MKDGLLEAIRSVGHWRINFRPVSVPEPPLLLGKCRELVERASVSVRGWDFPHINRHENDQHGGYTLSDTYVENWNDWSGFLEFWRMYASSQFLAYVALREDTLPQERDATGVRTLSTVGTVCQISEIVEFCHRLANAGLYDSGVSLNVALINTRDRLLKAGQFRIPFFTAMRAGTEKLELERTIDAEVLRSRHRSVAVDLCIQLFDRFGWNPDRSQIEAEQEKFYRQDWR